MGKDGEKETMYSFYVSEKKGEPKDINGMSEERRKAVYDGLGRQFVEKGLSGQALCPQSAEKG